MSGEISELIGEFDSGSMFIVGASWQGWCLRGTLALFSVWC